METNWTREIGGLNELTLCRSILRAVRKFYQSFEDPVVRDRLSEHEDRLKFREVITPIVLSAYDAIESDDPLVASRATIPKAFLEKHQIDWGYVEGALHALMAVDAIKFESVDVDHCVYRPSTLIAEEEVKESEANPLFDARLLDVHLSSEHPEARKFVDEIYQAHFKGGNAKIRKKHLQVVLLNLYVCWCEDPERPIAYWRDSNAYKAKSRYNELFISDKTVAVVDRLIEIGLVEHAIGFKNRKTGRGFISRMWGTETLVQKFKEAQFGPLDVDAHSNQECIVLRKIVKKRRKKAGTDEYEEYDKSVDVEYEDSKNTKRMREQLTAYNDLLKRTFIDIPRLEVPYIEKEESREKARLYITQRDKFVRRIFNRGSWDKGGRFWGGWWQRCPKEYRPDIFLNDEPTSEIDYSGLHIVLLYAMEKIDYWKEINVDPYTIDYADLDVTPDKLRSICKQLILVALNAKNEKSTLKAFRDEAEEGSFEKSLEDEQLRPLLQKLREMHEPIADKFASDAGIDLMRIDSEITARIIKHYTDNLVPILTIHDSYLVPMNGERNLEEQMVKAFEDVTGISDVRLKEETVNPYRWEPQSWEDALIVSPAAWEKSRNARVDPPRSPRYEYQLNEFRKRVPELDTYLRESRNPNPYVD